MKIVVMSDSHGLVAPIAYIKARYPDAEYLIHCGDICLNKNMMHGIVAVCGNCDDPDMYPNGKIMEVCGHRILIIHGHVLFDSDHPDIQKVVDCAKRNQCDIAFFGHSHLYCDEVIDGIHVCNPGSLFHNNDCSKPSYMYIELGKDTFSVTRQEYDPFKNEKQNDF